MLNLLSYRGVLAEMRVESCHSFLSLSLLHLVWLELLSFLFAVLQCIALHCIVLYYSIVVIALQGLLLFGTIASHVFQLYH